MTTTKHLDKNLEQLFTPEISRFAGLLGVATYILAYALLQTGVIGGNSFAYAGMNGAAAILVIISLLQDFNLASLMIQVAFLSLSLIGIARVALLTRLARFSDEEAKLIRAQFPDLPPHLARVLLDAGTWADTAKGSKITRQGEDVGTLYYLCRGSATVMVDGHLVGTRDAPAVIGELSFMDGTTASATVTASTPLRSFVLPCPALRALMKRHADLRLSVLAGFSGNTRETLLTRTRELARFKGSTVE